MSIQYIIHKSLPSDTSQGHVKAFRIFHYFHIGYKMMQPDQTMSYR
jgi:hypothetical protein